MATCQPPPAQIAAGDRRPRLQSENPCMYHSVITHCARDESRKAWASGHLECMRRCLETSSNVLFGKSGVRNSETLERITLRRTFPFPPSRLLRIVSSLVPKAAICSILEFLRTVSALKPFPASPALRLTVALRRCYSRPCLGNKLLKIS